LLTMGGGFCILAAILLMQNVAGSLNIDDLLAASDVLHASPLYPIIVVLLLIGAFVKSAQEPLHIWLPTAMAAPTPISCYLHSATMVKAGIYLIARMTPILGGTILWGGIITVVGLTSLTFGSLMAIRLFDMKGILAYSTISQLGLIISLFGFGTEAAIAAGLFHLLNHSAFKGSLFLMTGIVDHQTGTRDVRLLKGLDCLHWFVFNGWLAAFFRLPQQGAFPGGRGRGACFQSGLYGRFGLSDSVCGSGCQYLYICLFGCSVL